MEFSVTSNILSGGSRLALVRHVSVALLLFCIGIGCARAQAQEENPLGASNANSTTNVGQARAHFGRGVQYYEDGDYSAALLEFERAYALQHAYQLLYNLGQVSTELRDYAKAERYFRDYLSKGGSAIEPERRAEVIGELGKLKARVGSLRITTNMSGAEIRLDDRVIEHPDSGPVRVSAGRREIVAEKPGYAPVRRAVDVLGGEEQSVALVFGAPVATSSGDSSNVLPWITGITSAVVLIGAGAVGYWAYKDSSDYKNELDHITTQARLDQLSSGARSKALVADVLLGTAVAGGIVTVILVLSGGTRETSGTDLTKPGVTLGSNGRGVQLQF
jgi:tetratricopeptide (TPR) repeat protein